MKHGLLFLLGIMLCCVGFTGSMWASTLLSGIEEGEVFYTPQIMHDVRGIEIDSEENIYVDSQASDTIQCFGQSGEFQYGIFMGNLYYTFGIDEDDMLHVIQGVMHKVYKNGEFLFQEELHTNEEIRELSTRYNANGRKTTYAKNGDQYEIKGDRIIVTSYNHVKSIIPLEIPFWPLSDRVNLLLFFGGMGICFISFCKIADIKVFGFFK